MIYTAINGNSYDSATGKLVATGVGQNQTSITNQVSVSSLRSQMANGTITPAQALAQLTAGAGPMTEANQNALAAAKTQLFQPMTINKGGQIMNLNNDGSVTVQSTTVNNSTTTGSGTTTSTQNKTPGQATTQTVKSGDTLSQIAASNGMTTQQLIALNPQISNPNMIHPGDTVNLSTPQGATTGANINTQGNGGGTQTNSTTGQNGGQTGSPQGSSDIPQPTPTGNAALDAAQQAQYDYVTGSLAQGYTINPALTGSNLAAMLPQFIQQTATQLEPELLQNFQSEMAGVNLSLNTLAQQYTASQGKTIQDFQQSLGTLRNANQWGLGGGENTVEQASANNTNRTLASLDAGFANQAGGVMQAAGSTLGQGVPSDFLSNTGAATTPGLSGFGASSIQAPNVNPLTVNLQGGNSVLAGSSGQGNALNYNYDPSIYKYGSIPTTFGTNFGSTLNQLFGNYQQGVAATPTSSQTAPITSSYGNSLPSSPTVASTPIHTLPVYQGGQQMPVFGTPEYYAQFR